MCEAYDRINEGLNEALAFAEGRETGAIAHQIEVPSIEIPTPPHPSSNAAALSSRSP